MKKEWVFNDKWAIFLSGILGIVVFLLIYGPYSLDVCNDAWILSQYDGPDIVQNYAGWTQYRISDWNYPLGYANKLSYSDGTYITYTDSIPYVAIICKLFRNILPPTFQYFGWFTMACFVLQGIGACLLIKRKHRSYVKVLLGDVFFLTAPILIERVFKHTALGAQWFILFAIYYYLEYRSGNEKKLPWQLIALAGLTIGIHPYFLPMVMIFVALVIAEALKKKYTVWKIAAYTVCSVGIPYMLGVVIGALGVDVDNSTRSGYGYFGMNLNALINPRSHGGFEWSHVIGQREWIWSTYEGFNYLGLGIILMSTVCGVVFFLELLRKKEYYKTVLCVIKKNILLICGMLFMTLFAITNNIAWDNQAIVQIPLPGKVVELASIFRSSGRMFYPVYYLIMLTLMYYLLDKFGKKTGTILVALFLFVQVYDMRDVYVEKYNCMKENYEKVTVMDDETLKNMPDKKVLLWVGEENFEVQRVLTVWAARHNMGVAYSVANTGKYTYTELYVQGMHKLLQEGDLRDDAVYATMSEDILWEWRTALAGKEYTEYKRGFYYFIYSE